MRKLLVMIQGVSHLTFVVRDLERATAFWQEIFEAVVVYDSGDETHSLSRERFLLVGNLWIALMEGEPLEAPTYNHIAFAIDDADFEHYRVRLEEAHVRMRPPRPRISGEGRSLYFYDEDNHLFELHTGTLAERLAAYRMG